MSLIKKDNKHDRFFLVVALIGWLLWIISVSPLRIYAMRTNVSFSWAFDAAPSFFAGFTFVFFQAFAVKSRPLASVAYAAVLVTAAEVAQLYMPRYTFDKWDLVAGIIGVAIAMPILFWRKRKRSDGTSL